MSNSDEKLDLVTTQLKNGIAPEETVRSFLRWFGAGRRSNRVVRSIRDSLEKHGLTTVPDFEYAYLDGCIRFQLPSRDGNSPDSVGSESSTDPTNRIGRLDSANILPVSVKPDAPIQEAATLMLMNDYSQLPVMVSNRSLKGVISWETIGIRLALGKECSLVSECMEPAQVVSIEDSFFSAITMIAEYDYALVRRSDNRICGIVTASDFNDQFRKLAEPFLLVGEIENGIRRILHGKFSVAELRKARSAEGDERTIGGVADLTFGEYIRLIQFEEHWKKLNIEVDRVKLVSGLDRVRDIRNDVMHFDPDGLTDPDLCFLRTFALFLKKLRDLDVA